MNGQSSGIDYYDNLIKLAKARQKAEQDRVNNYKTGREWDTLKAQHDYELAKLNAMKVFYGQGGYNPKVQSLSNARTSQPNYQEGGESYE